MGEGDGSGGLVFHGWVAVRRMRIGTSGEAGNLLLPGQLHGGAAAGLQVPGN